MGWATNEIYSPIKYPQVSKTPQKPRDESLSLTTGELSGTKFKITHLGLCQCEL